MKARPGIDPEYVYLKKMLATALASVDQVYYRTSFENLNAISQAIRLTGRFGNDVEGDDDTFYRYGERVFCYELYHALRCIYKESTASEMELIKGAVFQGEVNKIQVLELIQHFGLEELNGEYAPDFLLHTPGTSEHHSCVIEVKCNPALSRGQLLMDLQKINEFITKYRYRFGFFIATNVSQERVLELIEPLTEKLGELQGRKQIQIFIKESQTSDLSILNV
jgi:hypothetical protein